MAEKVAKPILNEDWTAVWLGAIWHPDKKPAADKHAAAVVALG